MPADISFTPEEGALLGLAAMVWREGSLSEESRRALLKLKSLGDTTDEPVLGYQPRIQVRDSAFEPLRTALEPAIRRPLLLSEARRCGRAREDGVPARAGSAPGPLAPVRG